MSKILEWRMEYRHKCGATTFYVPTAACCFGCGEVTSQADYEQVAREIDRTGWTMKYTGREKNHGRLSVG